MVTIAAIDLLPHTSSLFIALSEKTYFMLFIIVLSFIGQYIGDVIKRIKFSKKVSHRVENLKIEVLLLFFESSFWNNQQSFFTISCFDLSLILVTYVYVWFYYHFQWSLIKHLPPKLKFVFAFQFLWAIMYFRNVTIATTDLISDNFQNPCLLRFQKTYTLCGLLLMFHDINVSEGVMYLRRLENLKIQVLLIFSNVRF